MILNKTKLLSIFIIGLFFGTSIIPTIMNDDITVEAESRDVLFEDNFNDNNKNYGKWSEIFNDGTWEETNQRTEFYVNEPGMDPRVYEGIESSSFDTQLSSSKSVTASCNFITDIGSTGWVGHLTYELREGNKFIRIRYYRGQNEVRYCDDASGETVLCSLGDGTYNVEIESYLDKYKVSFGSHESSWVYKSVFSSNPSLEVRLYIDNAGSNSGYNQKSVFDDVEVTGTGGGEKPTPCFTMSNDYPRVGEEIIFDASCTEPNGGTITDYAWDFDYDTDDDAWGKIVTHTYTNPGPYTVKLWVKDSEGKKDQILRDIIVSDNNPPVADAGGPYSADVDEEITFDASDSYDSDGTIEQYRWKWKTGGSWTAWSSSPDATHSYNVEIDDWVTVEVMDDDGAKNADSAKVSIGGDNQPPATPEIVHFPENPSVGENKEYVARSEGDPDGDNYYFQFDWGDGSMSNWIEFEITESGEEGYCYHTYGSPGIYYIKARTKDEHDTTTGEWSEPIIVDVSESNIDVMIEDISPVYSQVGEKIYLTAYVSDKEEDHIDEYCWVIGSDRQIHTDKKRLSINDLNPGIYSVRLWAKDCYGEIYWSDESSQITVFNCDVIHPPFNHCESETFHNSDKAGADCNSGGLFVYSELKNANAYLGSDYDLERGKFYGIKARFEGYGGATKFATSRLGVRIVKNTDWDWFYFPTSVDQYWKWDSYALVLNACIGMLIPWDMVIPVDLTWLQNLIGNSIPSFSAEAISALSYYNFDMMNQKSSPEIYEAEGILNLKDESDYHYVGVILQAHGASGGSWWNDYGKVNRWGNIPYILVWEASEQEFEDLMHGQVNCPVDITVEDPAGRILNKTVNEIPFADFCETIADSESNETRELFTIPKVINGSYKFYICPETDADYEDTFSFKIMYEGKEQIIADEMRIDELKEEPFQFDVNSCNPPYIKIKYPTSSMKLKNNVTIRWDANDYEDNSNIPISIYYSEDGKNIWSNVISDYENAGEYIWDTTSLPDGSYSIKIETVDSSGNIRYDTIEYLLIENGLLDFENHPPNKPDKPLGDKFSFSKKGCKYSTSTYDTDGNKLWYQWKWGENSQSGWIGPFDSNETCEIVYNWSECGFHNVQVKAKDKFGWESECSDPLTIIMQKNKTAPIPIFDWLIDWLINQFPIF